jgi:hypothetical protein
MANIDASFGFRPVNNDGAKGSRMSPRRYKVAAADATDLFPGDPVILTGTSIIDAQSGLNFPVVTRATAGDGNYVTGVVVDFIPVTDDSLRYKVDAVTERDVLVIDDPEQLYEIQADGSVAITDIGNTADIIFTNAGDQINGQSGAELDTSDIGTGDQLVIEGVSTNPVRSDLSSANPVLLVRFNLHQKRNTTGV